MDRYCFRSLPAHRQGLGWDEASFVKLSSSYLKIPATQKAVKDYSTVIYYGAIDPRCIPAAMMWCSLRRGQKTFLATEGLRFRQSSLGSKGFGLLLNHPKLEILAIGHQCADDFRQAGLTKPKYRKYGFFENYPTHVQYQPSTDDICRILSVGQLIDRKNFLSIVYSLQRIANRSAKRISYTICGEGVQRPELESEIRKLPKHIEVNLLGNCNSEELERCFRSADIFAMPSKYDGWGVVLNQAIHFQLPVIVSNGVRAARDYLVQNGFNGFIFDSDIKLDEGLAKLVSDEELRSRFSYNSREIADVWHIDSVAGNLARVILEKEPQRASEFFPLGEI